MLCLGAAAQAQPATPDEAAKARYLEAQALYDTGKFEAALNGYSAAYELKPLPGFLFNIGQCHRQLGNWERARFFYKRYLDLSPKRPKNAAQVRSLLEQVEDKLAEQEAQRQIQERAAKLEQQRKEAELANAKREAQLEAAKKQAQLDRQKKQAELAQARQLAAIEAEKEARKAALERSLKEAPPAPAVSTPLYTKWWLWAGIGAAVAGGAYAYVATAPKPGPTTLGEVSLR